MFNRINTMFNGFAAISNRFEAFLEGNKFLNRATDKEEITFIEMLDRRAEVFLSEAAKDLIMNNEESYIKNLKILFDRLRCINI